MKNALELVLKEFEKDWPPVPRSGLVQDWVLWAFEVDQLERANLATFRAVLAQNSLKTFLETADGQVLLASLKTIGVEFICDEAGPGWVNRRECTPPTAVGDKFVIGNGEKRFLAQAIGRLDDVPEDCPACRRCFAHAHSDATTPGFFYDKCEKHRVKD